MKVQALVGHGLFFQSGNAQSAGGGTVTVGHSKQLADVAAAFPSINAGAKRTRRCLGARAG